MGKTTGIGWTDSTINFWWGCTKVSTGPLGACEHCYAEQWAKATGNPGLWGLDAPRRKINSAVPMIRKLNATRPGARVFCSSMSDLFDNEVSDEWFAEAWAEIHIADRLRLQLVTKRLPIIEKRLAAIGAAHWPQHAGLIISVVTQAEVDRDVPRARALKAKLGIPWLGLSVEPQMEHMILLSRGLLDGVDWVISGGESKQGKRHVPRPYDLAWARSLRDQCGMARTAYFQKQMGSRPVSFADELGIAKGRILLPGTAWTLKFNDRAGADPAEWPPDLRVQQFPEALR